LDMDYLGKPFGPLPQLMAVAEYVTKVHAICMKCGNLAHVSHRTVDNPSRIMLGEQESYIPLCRMCYNEVTKRPVEK
jgi:thymidine kinase